MSRKIKQLCYLLLLSLLQPASAEITKTIVAETQLVEWKLIDSNLELQLIQRLPDQTRSFFEARGFSKTITNNIANSCVFQTVARNTSKNKNQPVHISLSRWLIKINGHSQSLKLKENWEQEWADLEIKASSRLAFRWATFPTEQTFEPSGDYNWGMISFGPTPGQVFDLYIEWKNNQQIKSAWIKNIICAEDR